MTKLLLDTDTLNYLTKGRRPALDHYEGAIEKRAIFLLCPVTQYELTRYFELRGMSRLMQNYEEITGSWQRCDLSLDDWREAASLGRASSGWSSHYRYGSTDCGSRSSRRSSAGYEQYQSFPGARARVAGLDGSDRLSLSPHRRKNANSSRLIRRSTFFSGTSGRRLTRTGAKLRTPLMPASAKAS
jgi:hypothetical protein